MDINNWDKFLGQLKGAHEMHRLTKEREGNAKISLEMKRRDAGSYLELLGKNTFIDEKDGFKVFVRKYKRVHILDKKAFMRWLKENLSPVEVIDFLCPPTTKKDLNDFVTKLCEESKDPFFNIEGLEIETSHIRVNTTYIGGEK